MNIPKGPEGSPKGSDPLKAVFQEAALLLKESLARLGPLPLKKAGVILQGSPGFGERLKRFRGGLGGFVKLFPEHFLLVGGTVKLPGQRLAQTTLLDLPPVQSQSPLVLPWIDFDPRPPPPSADHPLRAVRTEPHELHRDVSNTGPLTRPDPLTEIPTDGHSSQYFPWPDDAASEISGASSAFDASLLPDHWIVLARRDSEGRGLGLGAFELRRLAMTLRERFGFNILDAQREIE